MYYSFLQDVLAGAEVSNMVATRTDRIRIGDVSVLLREAGPPDSRNAIVFVHGNPGSSEDFTKLVEKIGESRRVLAPDMPGYGKSDRPTDFNYTVEGYAEFLGRVLDEAGVERAILALHDFGGPWGLTWAASNLDRVEGLILFNTGLLPGYRWHKFARIWRTPIIGELNMLLTTKAMSWRRVRISVEMETYPSNRIIL